MKKIFAFLLSMGLLFGMANTIKINAEPTDLCKKLVFYLNYDSILRGFTPFSPEQLKKEINNYNENDFAEEDRPFNNKAMSAYQEALNVYNEVLERNLPENVLDSIVPDQDLDNSNEYENQVNVFCKYLFKHLSTKTRSVCWKSDELDKEFIYSDDFYNENKEFVTRFLCLLREMYSDDDYSCFSDEEIHKVLIFLARGFFKGDDNEIRFFRMDIGDANLINISLMAYNGVEISEIDSLDWNL